MYSLLWVNFFKVLISKFFKRLDDRLNILDNKKEDIKDDFQASGLYIQLNDGTISEIRMNGIESLEVLRMRMKIISYVWDNMMLDLWWRGI